VSATQAEVLGRRHFVARGLKLEYFTIVYNCLEALVGLAAGFLAGSIALIGFGFDSLIEVTSGAAVLWRLSSDVHEDRRERIEAASLHIIGVCFFALAVYVGYESIAALIRGEPPDHSIPGIILGITSLIVMPLLARAKRRVARSIGSVAMAADARQTDFCTYLSAVLVGGLLLNAVLGWWWADPIAGLVMTPLIGKEGVDAFRGRACGCSAGTCH
jgi:cation diffusion facilitator family transporter